MKICIIIPVYNHEAAIPQVLAQLKNFGIPVLLVNDGSSALCSQVLADCAKQQPDWLSLINRSENGGKGAATMDGFKAAQALGFSHAIQIDADGQHDVNDIPAFIEAGRQHPDTLILGRPLFDDTAPKSRVYGRTIANLWVWINTLSFAIEDSMCGFRLYPLAAVAELTGQAVDLNRSLSGVEASCWLGSWLRLRSASEGIRSASEGIRSASEGIRSASEGIRSASEGIRSVSCGTRIAERMDFDIDILVRLYWQGVEVINIPTAVRYPYDGVSHFKLWRDNLMISKTHAKLFFGMLMRIPQLLGRHRR